MKNVVVNTPAVKRAELRGVLWSSAGKRVEKPLTETLCKRYSVSEKNYKAKFKKDNTKGFDREIDFYLLKDDKEFLCEVKLMGKGNPESADAIFAREPAIFLADKLSDKNKRQAEMLNVQWIELRNDSGYKRFQEVLNALNVPNSDLNGDLNTRLDEILKEIYGE